MSCFVFGHFSNCYSIVKQSLFNLIPGAADALFADFADVLVACFVGFACFVALFGELHHDEFAVPAVLGVELHDSVGGGSRAREEVEDKISFFSRCRNQIFNQNSRLRKAKCFGP